MGDLHPLIHQDCCSQGSPQSITIVLKTLLLSEAEKWIRANKCWVVCFFFLLKQIHEN